MKTIAAVGIAAVVLAVSLRAIEPVSAQTPKCDPTVFAAVKGCRIAAKNCVGSSDVLCTLCKKDDPTSRVIVTILNPTHTGLDVQMTCPNSAQFTTIPAVNLVNYIVTECP